MSVHTPRNGRETEPARSDRETVRANLKRLRERENLGYAQLSRRLDKLGR